MHPIRVHDAARRPRDWSGIVTPAQYVVFPSLLDGGAPCDATGVATGHEAAVCLLADSLPEAEAFCRAEAERHPAVRFDIFDANGRRHPPLITVVHPSRAGDVEGIARPRLVLGAAVSLLLAAPVLFWADWWFGLMGLPTLLGLNALVFAGRLLQLRAAVGGAERQRAERLRSHAAASDGERS